jgi:hypothetical protein
LPPIELPSKTDDKKVPAGQGGSSPPGCAKGELVAVLGQIAVATPIFPASPSMFVRAKSHVKPCGICFDLERDIIRAHLPDR